MNDDAAELPPLTIAAINRLGRRIRDADDLSSADIKMLQRLGADHLSMLTEVQDALRPLRVSATGRVKTIQTIVDKLKRERRMALSRMQDIAGVRIVEDMNRREQDILVADVREIARAFGSVSVMDRRRYPSAGYRAVHVIVTDRGRSVEVQVRTLMQDQWAQIVERLGDTWGRQIRYGGDPADPDTPVGNGTVTRLNLWRFVQTMSDLVGDCERLVADASLSAEGPSEELTNLQRELTGALGSLQDAAERGAL
jgi:hypothetical protein